MTRCFHTYRGIPLGIILKKDLKRFGISQKNLAEQIGMSYTNLNRSINYHRLFNIDEATKIDKFFGYEPGFVKKMQDYHLSANKVPSGSSSISIDRPNVRACVFWDVNIESLDWQNHRQFIIKRVDSYGNLSEKKSVHEFYLKLSVNEKN